MSFCLILPARNLVHRRSMDREYIPASTNWLKNYLDNYHTEETEEMHQYKEPVVTDIEKSLQVLKEGR